MLTADQLRQLRLLLKDRSESQVFTDADLNDFAAIEDGPLKAIAAFALETIAANDMARTLNYAKTIGLETNGKPPTEALCMIADRWRQQVKDAAEAAEQAAPVNPADHIGFVSLY